MIAREEVKKTLPPWNEYLALVDTPARRAIQGGQRRARAGRSAHEADDDEDNTDA